MKRRIGIFGGSFDPIHEGHTTIAKKALEMTHLDEVIFVPAKKNPLKKTSPQASDEHRVEMISQAIDAEKAFHVNTCEISRATPSFTIETVQFFKKQYPHDILFLIIGADSAESFYSWKDPEDILKLVEKIIIYPRINSKIPEQLTPHVLLLKEDLLPFSSTLVRNSPRYAHLHPSVVAYIKKHGLYK